MPTRRTDLDLVKATKTHEQTVIAPGFDPFVGESAGGTLSERKLRTLRISGRRWDDDQLTQRLEVSQQRQPVKQTCRWLANRRIDSAEHRTAEALIVAYAAKTLGVELLPQ